MEEQNEQQSKCPMEHCSFPECNHVCGYVPEYDDPSHEWENVFSTPKGYRDL